MLKIVVLTIVALVAALLIYAATQPDTFRVQRSATINTPVSDIYPLIDDLHNWAAWSPWEKKDPSMKHTFSGPLRGKGAALEWEGNNDVGAGRMEILESTSPSSVLIKLDFLKPFEGHNMAEFSLSTDDAATTRVTWAMYGPQPYMMKVMHTVLNLDKVVGKDFETGLANLKAIAETREKHRS